MTHREDEPYNGQDKFGTPEGYYAYAPQTYLLGDGREVEEEEFLNVLRREARERGITPNTPYGTTTP